MTLPDSTVFSADASMWLCDLAFVDLYVSLDIELPSYYQATETYGLQASPKHLPIEYQRDIAQLRRELEIVLRDQEETSLIYDGMRLRASRVCTTKGETWAALRRVASHPPALDKIGFLTSEIRALRELGVRDGLVLISGGTGQGKTTTANALLYDFLINHGGVAFSIEDPVEYVIDGWQGNSGLCYQVEVRSEDDWAKYLQRGLRWHPRYIMVGELRTPEAANQALRAANSGHLVITTMHAGSLEESLEGLTHLAGQAIGAQAPRLLASGLAAVMYQSFLNHSVSLRLYVAQAGHLGDPVRALIREQKIGQVTTFVDQQTARRSMKVVPL